MSPVVGVSFVCFFTIPVLNQQVSVAFADDLVGDAIDSEIRKKYYYDVRTLDEIDNRWPHAVKGNVSRQPSGRRRIP
jgi:hypothetical protein